MKGMVQRAPLAAGAEAPTSARSGEHRKAPTNSSNGTILIVDPSNTLVSELEPLVTEEGLELAPVEDGKQALESAVEEPPELIISRTELPRMNGIDLCRALRATEWLGRIPFILLADHLTRELLAMATECGADLCLSDPVDPVRLFELVRALLR